MNFIKEWTGVAAVVLLACLVVAPYFTQVEPPIGAAGGQYMEQYIPVVRYNGGMATALPFDMDGTSANLAVGGTLAVTGASTFTGAATFSSTIAGLELSEAVTADNTITAAESGTTFYVSGAIATSTLPAVTNTGAVFTFVVGAALTGDHLIVSAAGDDMEGNVNGTTTVDAADRVWFSSSIENLGDTVTVRSNGTIWAVQGSSLAPSGIVAGG